MPDLGIDRSLWYSRKVLPDIACLKATGDTIVLGTAANNNPSKPRPALGNLKQAKNSKLWHKKRHIP